MLDGGWVSAAAAVYMMHADCRRVQPECVSEVHSINCGHSNNRMSETRRVTLGQHWRLSGRHILSGDKHVEAFEQKVRASFARQQFMTTLGAEMASVGRGAVEIRLPFSLELTQQDQFVHAGAITSILDSACGYAALSVAPAKAEVLSVEFKVNLLSPAVGDVFVARAMVKRSGKTLCVCTADAFAVKGKEEKLIATMLATIIHLTPK